MTTVANFLTSSGVGTPWMVLRVTEFAANSVAYLADSHGSFVALRRIKKEVAKMSPAPTGSTSFSFGGRKVRTSPFQYTREPLAPSVTTNIGNISANSATNSSSPRTSSMDITAACACFNTSTASGQQQ